MKFTNALSLLFVTEMIGRASAGAGPAPIAVCEDQHDGTYAKNFKFYSEIDWANELMPRGAPIGQLVFDDNCELTLKYICELDEVIGDYMVFTKAVVDITPDDYFPGSPAPGGSRFNDQCLIEYCGVDSVTGEWKVEAKPSSLISPDEYIPGGPAPELLGPGKIFNDQCGIEAGGANPTSYGDPHFKTWNGKNYDFHGACDLLLLQNPNFSNGLGMNIHIRTVGRTSWSFIESAIIQIGDNKLAMIGGVGGGSYWINDMAKTQLQTGDAALGDFPVRFVRVNDHQTRARVDLGNGDAVAIETFKDFVRVNIGNKSKKAFVGSMGLLGRYPDGLKVGRDGATVIEDPNEFGEEWMVHPSDPILFPDVEASQLPLQCTMPDADAMKESRRRLGESAITSEEAAMACARVLEADRDACIFDVLATNDKDMAGSY